MTHDQDILSEASSLLSIANEHCDGTENGKLRWVLAIGFVTLGRLIGAIAVEQRAAREAMASAGTMIVGGSTKGKAK